MRRLFKSFPARVEELWAEARCPLLCNMWNLCGAQDCLCASLFPPLAVVMFCSTPSCLARSLSYARFAMLVQTLWLEHGHRCGWPGALECNIRVTPLTLYPVMCQARWRPLAQQQTAERAAVAEAGAVQGHDAAATPRGLSPKPDATYHGDAGPAVGSPALSAACASQTPLIGGRQPVSVGVGGAAQDRR